MKTAVWTDPVVAETRKWREEILAECEYDLGRLAARLIESQVRHGNKLVNLESKAPRDRQVPEDKGLA